MTPTRDLSAELLVLHHLEIRHRAKGHFEFAQQAQRKAEFIRDRPSLPYDAAHLCCWYDRGAVLPIRWDQIDYSLVLSSAPYDRLWIFTPDRALEVWKILSEYLGFTRDLE